MAQRYYQEGGEEMRKYIWWIIGGGSLLLGMVLLTAAFFGGAKGIYLSDDGFEVAGDTIVIEETVKGGFTSVDIDCDIGEIELRASKDGSYGYRLEYTDDYFHSNQLEVINGTLTVTNRHTDKTWTVNRSIPWKYDPVYKLSVTYPAGTKFDNVDAVNALGTIRLNDFETDSLNVTANLGDVRASNVISYGTVMTLDLGHLDFDGELYGGTDIRASLGDVNINTDVAEEEYEFIFDVELGNITIGGKNIRADNGKVTGGSGRNSLRVNCDLGSIDIDFGKRNESYESSRK
jgi:hypothetical protein